MLIIEHKGFTFAKKNGSNDIVVFVGETRLAMLRISFTDDAFKVSQESVYKSLVSHIDILKEAKPHLTPGSHMDDYHAKAIALFDTTEEKHRLDNLVPTTTTSRPKFRL